jgi:hypothetical protein
MRRGDVLLKKEKEYVNWLIEYVTTGARKRHIDRAHRAILRDLYSIEFTWILDMDENRAIDGLEMRGRFGIDLGDWPCSMLEMMVALAIREDNIMGYYISEDCGPDTWFWEQMDNSGLSNCHSMDEVQIVVDRINNREYSERGEGGLFFVPEPRRDLREVDIWYQMQWHLAQL